MSFFDKLKKSINDAVNPIDTENKNLVTTFRAEVNEGQTVYAEGSENFPQGYREFVSTLNRILRDDGLRSSI